MGERILIGAFENPERKTPKDLIGNIQGIFCGELFARAPEAETYYDALHRVVELKLKESDLNHARQVEHRMPTAQNQIERIRAEKIYEDELADAERQGEEDLVYRGSFNRLRVIADMLDEAYRGEGDMNPVDRTAITLSKLHRDLAEHVFADKQ